MKVKIDGMVWQGEARQDKSVKKLLISFHLLSIDVDDDLSISSTIIIIHVPPRFFACQFSHGSKLCL
jgi:hypothetical protein